MVEERLLRYAHLLASGAMEAQRLTKERFEQKKALFNKISSEHHPQYLLEMQTIVEYDIALAKRVLHWMESRDSNLALELLQKSIATGKILGIEKELEKILKLSKKEDELIRELLECFLEQHAISQRFFDKPAKAIKNLAKELERQKEILEMLFENGQLSKKEYATLLSKIFQQLQFLKGTNGQLLFSMEHIAEAWRAIMVQLQLYGISGVITSVSLSLLMTVGKISLQKAPPLKSRFFG